MGDEATVTRRRSLCQLAAVGSVGLGIPAALLHGLPDPALNDTARSLLDIDPEEMRKDLFRDGAGWVLIGNSMLNTRLRAKPLEEVSGWKVGHLGIGGSQSAIWWLVFKNIVVASGARPRWVTILFRESELTWADFRVGGENERLIRKLSTPDEPEWDRVMADYLARHRKSIGWSERIFPVGDWQVWARWQVHRLALNLSALDGTPLRRRRIQLNQLFSLGNLRRDLRGGDGMDAAIYQAADLDQGHGSMEADHQPAPEAFDPSPEASFLPHIVSLARAQGIGLHFHRVKRRPGPDGTHPDTVRYRSYLRDLEAWLRAQGCAYSDETPVTEITEEWYRDGDHLDESWRPAYVEKFWQLAGDQIGSPDQANGGPSAPESPPGPPSSR